MIQSIKQVKNAVIVLFALLFCAGAHAQSGKSAMTQSANDTKGGAQEASQRARIVEYRWRTNNWPSGELYGVFFNDGTAYLTDEWQENMEKMPPNAKYQKYPNYLRVKNEFNLQFFDDFGRIIPGWDVINSTNINSIQQITNLIPDLSKASLRQDDNVRYIEDTRLIILPFKQQKFEDEDSDEAQAYFSRADSWVNYVFDTEKKFKEMGVETIRLTEGDRFLSFKLYDGQSIAVDIRAEQNGAVYAALLYKKGYVPIIIDIVGSDEQNEQIEDYLFSESGDGEPPVKRWRTDGEESEPEGESRVASASAIPTGYRFFEKIDGDLNKDGIADQVLIIKGTDKEKTVHDENRGELDRNRRGLMVFFNDGDNYRLVLENHDCFSSENEDGGVYFAPELSVKIERGNLYIKYDHGRYGWWRYAFQYRNGDFVLIGYDDTEYSRGITSKKRSVNFSTKKMQTKININEDAEEAGQERLKESWKDLTIKSLLKLSEVTDFDELGVGYINKL